MTLQDTFAQQKLRREAARLGLKVEKFGKYDPADSRHGTYQVSRTRDSAVLYRKFDTGFGLSASEVNVFLREYVANRWKASGRKWVD